MQHLLFSGISGSGKNTYARAIIKELCGTAPVTLYTGETLPTKEALLAIGAPAVVVLDECAHCLDPKIDGSDFGTMCRSGVRFVVLFNGYEQLNPVLHAQMAQHGGFRHIEIGLNMLLADEPRPVLPDNIFSSVVLSLPNRNKLAGGNAVMIELLSAVDEIPFEARGQVLNKLSILAAALATKGEDKPASVARTQVRGSAARSAKRGSGSASAD